MTMRRVTLTKKVYPLAMSDKYTLEGDGEAWFHGFGLASKDKGAGASFTVAIVERDDGRLDTVLPYRVRFLDSPT